MASARTTSLIAIRQKLLDAMAAADPTKVNHTVDGESYDFDGWWNRMLEAVAKLDRQIAASQPFAKRLNQRAL